MVEIVGAVLALCLDVDSVGVELEALLRGVNADRQRRLLPCSHLFTNLPNCQIRKQGVEGQYACECACECVVVCVVLCVCCVCAICVWCVKE